MSYLPEDRILQVIGMLQVGAPEFGNDSFPRGIGVYFEPLDAFAWRDCRMGVGDDVVRVCGGHGGGFG